MTPENESAYRLVVSRTGDRGMLRQVFVHRAGHCAFTPAETITAARTLLDRLRTGRWDGAALRPASLNRRAGALSPWYNVFLEPGGKPQPAVPAFTRYRPPPFLRPFSRPANGGRPAPRAQ